MLVKYSGMKIGIDCRMYGSKQAGLGRYVQELVLGLEKIDSNNEYVIFLRQENWEEYQPIDHNFKKVLADISWYSLSEQLNLKKIIEREKVDLMHFPHWNVPLFYNKPFVVTIHDLIMYHYPRQEASTHGPIVYWLKDLAHRIVLRHAVKKAKQIIVTSEFTKQDVHKTLGVPLEKMTVVYQAPFQNEKLKVKREKSNLNKKSDLNKWGINKKYVLYVGNAYPHKNLEGLLKAWKIFEEKYGSDYQLVLVGKKNFFYDKLITSSQHHFITTSPHYDNVTMEQCNNIIFTGYVPDEDLAQFYTKASLYVFPSFYEGFGLPPLEAMTYGVPVVSSNATCLPEILGEGALYFDPENLEQMAEVIYKGLNDKSIRFELREKAKEELKRYSDEKMIRETLWVYRNIKWLK